MASGSLGIRPPSHQDRRPCRMKWARARLSPCLAYAMARRRDRRGSEEWRGRRRAVPDAQSRRVRSQSYLVHVDVARLPDVLRPERVKGFILRSQKCRKPANGRSKTRSLDTLPLGAASCQHSSASPVALADKISTQPLGSPSTTTTVTGRSVGGDKRPIGRNAARRHRRGTQVRCGRSTLN